MAPYAGPFEVSMEAPCICMMKTRSPLFSAPDRGDVSWEMSVTWMLVAPALASAASTAYWLTTAKPSESVKSPSEPGSANSCWTGVEDLQGRSAHTR